MDSEVRASRPLHLPAMKLTHGKKMKIWSWSSGKTFCYSGQATVHEQQRNGLLQTVATELGVDTIDTIVHNVSVGCCRPRHAFQVLLAFTDILVVCVAFAAFLAHGDRLR